ncbi:MAG: hypothetical protein JKY60_11190 [Kordiimonadaceae bacterium]|nr:hypothetical protein [Kordiimonadaceae bacterium]
MLYLFAIIAPPLALLLCGKPIQAFLSGCFWALAFFLWIFGAGTVIWLVLAAHALFVVRDRNTRRMLEDIASRRD